MPAYIVMMGVAAALGLAKLVVVAMVLAAPEFGSYAGAAGGAAIGSALFSFGLIEGTIKRFPRFWSGGERGRIIGAAKWIGLRIVLLTSPILLIGIVIAYIALGLDGLISAIIIALFALVIVLGRVVSAMNQGIGDPSLIWRFSFFRSGAALILTIAGAYFFGWKGAIVGEIVAVLASNAQGIWLVRHALPLNARSEPAFADHHLYVSALFTNLAASGDRALVAALAGSASAGSYAFALLFAQIGQVFVNILGQKAGPEIIKAQRAGVSLRPTVALLVIPVLGTLTVATAMIVAAYLVGYLDAGRALFSKYGIGLAEIAVSCYIAITSLYVIVEYAAVSIDREKYVTLAGASSAIGLIFGAAVAWQQEAGPLAYLFALAFARSLQLAVLLFAVAPKRFLP